MSLPVKRVPQFVSLAFVVAMEAGCSNNVLVKQDINEKTGVVTNKVYENGKLISEKPDNSKEGLALSKKYRHTDVITEAEHFKQKRLLIRAETKKAMSLIAVESALSRADLKTRRDMAVQFKKYKITPAEMLQGEVSLLVDAWKNYKEGTKERKGIARKIVGLHTKNEKIVEQALETHRLTIGDIGDSLNVSRIPVCDDKPDRNGNLHCRYITPKVSAP